MFMANSSYSATKGEVMLLFDLFIYLFETCCSFYRDICSLIYISLHLYIFICGALTLLIWVNFKSSFSFELFEKFINWTFCATVSWKNWRNNLLVRFQNSQLLLWRLVPIMATLGLQEKRKIQIEKSIW